MIVFSNDDLSGIAPTSHLLDHSKPYHIGRETNPLHVSECEVWPPVVSSRPPAPCNESIGAYTRPTVNASQLTESYNRALPNGPFGDHISGLDM